MGALRNFLEEKPQATCTLFDVEKGVLQVTLSNDNIQTDTRKYFQSGSMKHVRYIYMRACGSGTFYDGRR